MERHRLRLIFILISCLLSNLHGQEIRLLFSSVYNGINLKTDSILVKNVTRSCDTLLHFPDSVLLLRKPIGLEDKSGNGNSFFDLHSATANPGDGITGFEVNCFTDLNFKVLVSDVSGRIRFSGTYHGNPGLHNFSIEPGENGLLIVSVTAAAQHSAVKLLSSHKNRQGTFRLKYNGVIKKATADDQLVSAGIFQFTPGDSLIFCGYTTPDSVAGSDVISFSPWVTDTVFFHILQGTPCPGLDLIRYEGQTYHTVKIGDQCWMKENLNVGTRIDLAIQQTHNGIIEKYCYKDTEENCSVYGGLYGWFEMCQVNDPALFSGRGICPEGWHPPSHDEWYNLVHPAGSPGVTMTSGNFKTTDTLYWNALNKASNFTGFSAIGGGYALDTWYYGLAAAGKFWSSGYLIHPHESGGEMWQMFADPQLPEVYPDLSLYFHSVRCIHD